jgi:small conductance mechanosensitive channel
MIVDPAPAQADCDDKHAQERDEDGRGETQWESILRGRAEYRCTQEVPTMWNNFVSVLGQMAQGAVGAQPQGSGAGGEMSKWEAIGKKAGELLTEYGLRVVGALIFLVGAWLVSSYLMRVTVRGLTRAHVDITLAKFLSNMSRWGLLVLVVIACLDIFGVPATSFVTVLGTAGLAIGLALQGALSHMAAGVMLLLFRPFRVGDTVVIAGQLGTVDEIELFTTHLDTPDMRRVIIPNGHIYGAIIQNITHHPMRRVDANVGVAYGADIENTQKVLTDAAANVPGRIADRPAEVNMAQLTPSSVDWTVVVWANAADAGAVKQALLKRIKEGLTLAGIEIPVPQMVVHSGNGMPAAAARS